MAFWGIEVKPGKPYNHNFDKTRGRLHVSQATLGIGSAAQRSVVQCNVGDKSPVLLCSLLPDKIESCSLDLEFEEDDQVVFSVLGPRSVHLTGFYLGQGQSCCDDDGDDTDSYGEDIGESESGSEGYDTEEEEYEDDFINDDDEDDELEMFPSPRPNSGVVIEEIVDDEKPTNGNGSRKRLKKKYEISDSDADDNKQIVVKGGNNFRVMESEDEDGFPISSQPESITTAKNSEGKSDKKIAKGKKKKKGAEEKSEKKIQTESKKEEDGVDNGAGIKRKIDNITQDGEAERPSEKPEDSSKPSTETGQEKSGKPKKKKKVRAEGKTEGDGDDSKDVQKVENTQPEAKSKDGPKDKQPYYKSMEIDAGNATTDEEHSAKKKKKKKKNKSKESETNAADEAKKGSVVESEDKEAEAKPSKMRTYANGLVIEDVKMGKPDGKKATPASKVSVRYIGKLKSNGKIFDSNIRGPPFKFILGVGQVIKGWDIGISGMRTGDKRRITIPPAMGYGDKGAGKEIPPNAWLIFDVELLEVLEKKSGK